MDKNKRATDTYNKIAQIYTDNYFEDLSEVSYIDMFLAKLPTGSKVLDVGSGPGQFTQYIISQRFSVSGIDFSEELVKIARKKSQKDSSDIWI